MREFNYRDAFNKNIILNDRLSEVTFSIKKENISNYLIRKTTGILKNSDPYSKIINVFLQIDKTGWNQTPMERIQKKDTKNNVEV